MHPKRILSFLVIASLLKSAPLAGIPTTALLLELETLRMQIEQAEVEQEVRDRVLELWAFTQFVALSPDYSICIKMEQLESLKCALLDFPEQDRQDALETVGRIGALLAEGSTAPDKPIKRDRPEIDPPAASCKVEILKLNTETDIFEVGSSSLIELDGPFRTVFLSARASEPPGSFDWSSSEWIMSGAGPGNMAVQPKVFPLPGDPSAPDRKVTAIETGNGILELSLTSEGVSQLFDRIVANVKVVFTSGDGQRKCEDGITISWKK